MSGTRTSIASLLFAAALSAQTLYLPLDEGNYWVYQGPGDTLVVQVGGRAVIAGREYAAVRGFLGPGEAWLRNDDQGRVLVWDVRTGQERLLLDPAAPDGWPWTSWNGSCTVEARTITHRMRSRYPVGEFDNVMHVRYGETACVDSRIAVEVEEWLPWVGLLRRVQGRAPDAKIYDLVYARLGDVTYVRAPQTGFSLSLTPAGGVLLAFITIRHTLEWPLVLNFSSSQRFDLSVYDSQGREIYRWSRDKAFLTVMGREEIRGERTWAAEIPMALFPRGDYAVRAWLTPIESHVWSASTFYRH
ncbi:MAG: BsuPI-related putative proteinase inhibitor [Bryobacteraceae bacterium]|nr:BsuPI-related putative proteinase inhibitor [Bryobacteraceae bacterium]